MESLESLDLGAYADTPLALETGLAEGREFWFAAPLAGMQFYDHGRKDGLGGRVVPAPGDRLHLVRRPDNPADANAVEVWWKNEHMLGHLPRDTAADIAGPLDAGKAARAYVLRPGCEGETWSLEVLVVGAAAEGRHASRVRAWVKDQVREATMAIWPTRYEEIGRDVEPRWGWYTPGFHVPAPPPPTPEQAEAAAAFEAEVASRRAEREAGAVFALSHLPKDYLPLPEGADAAPDEAQRGKVFGWWDEVPAWLFTKTKLREHGLRPRKGAAPFASIAYAVRRQWREFALFTVAEAEPVPFNPGAAAKAAERLRRHNPGAEAMRQRAEERDAYHEAKRAARWRQERDWSGYDDSPIL